jgi:hypothetical protein
MILPVFAAGAALLIAALRAWRPGLRLRTAAAYLALTAAFFALPLFAGRLQAGTDLPYVWLPWSEAAAGPVRPANNLVFDVALQMLPFRTLARQRLLAGEAPLWANELGTGQPLLGNAQSAPFAPLHLLALALPPARAMTAAAAWQMLLGLLLMHLLARALGAGGAGAALAAAGFALSTFAVTWMYHPIGMTAAWLPGVLLGILALRRGEPRAFAGLVACALGLALGGNPEIMAQGALLAAAFAAALLLPWRGRGPEPPERPGAAPPRPPGQAFAPRPARPGAAWFTLRLAAAAALAACLAAPALLPFVEAMPESVRAAVVAQRPDEVQVVRFTPRYLAQIVSPLVFGSPRDGHWSGPPGTNYNELCSDYAGLVTLALALAGGLAGALALAGGRRRPERTAALGELRPFRLPAALAAGGLLALLAALRISPFYDAVRLLPLLGDAPVSRLRLLWVVAVALGAGLSLERLAAAPLPRRAAAAALAAAAAGAALLQPAPGTPWQRAAWGAALLAAAAALATLLLPRLRRRFPAVVAAGVVVELLLLGVRYQPAVDPRFDLAAPPALAFLAGQAGQAGQAGAPAGRPPFRVLAEGGDLHPNLGALYGLWDPRGNDAMRPAAAARVVARRLDPGQEAHDQLALRRVAAPAAAGLDFLAVRYLLLRHDRQPPAPWRPVFDGVGGRVWENPAALPLFFMPHRAGWVEGDPAALAAAAVADADLAALVLRAGRGAETRQSGEVGAIRARANGFDLEVRSPTGGTVASSVSWAPGWRVAVDGGPAAATLEVDAGFIGFAMPPGAHRVRLDYRPRGWVWGLRLAALGGLAGFALLAAAGRHRRIAAGRRRAAPARAYFG